MRRFILTSLSVVLLLSLTVTAVFAQNPHFIGNVSFTDLGTQLQVRGSIAGLGSQNVDVQVTAQGSATTQCANPAGNVAPGQTKPVTVVGSVSNLETKNGRVTFNVTTIAPTAP